MLDTEVKSRYLKELHHASEQLSIELDDSTSERLIAYLELLVKWNKAYNLTAIRNPDDMLIKHLFDSLTIIPFIKGSEIADIGTGAGLPGIPMAIIYPDKKFTLVDSNGKKTRFLTQVKMALGLSNLTVIHGRVEEIPNHSKFDHITSRAFTALDNMVHLCKHLLLEGGTFLAMKGVEPLDEIKSLPDNYLVQETIALHVPGCEDSRHLIIISQNK